MFKVDDKRIRTLMLARRWSARDLKLKANLNYKTVRKLIYGGRVQLLILYRVAELFDVEPKELIESQEGRRLDVYKVNGRKVCELLRWRRWSIADFMRATGMGYQTCSKLAYGGKVQLNTLQKAAEVFGVDVKELIITEAD